MQIDLNIKLSAGGNINMEGLVKEIEKLELNKEVMAAVLREYEGQVVKSMEKEGWIKHGKRKRTIKTKFGQLSLQVQRMKRGNKVCMPLLLALGIEGKQRYTKDIKFSAADSALKLSYRDAEEETEKQGVRVPKSRIHSFVQEIGPAVKAENNKALRGEQDTVMGDGTKAHGNNGRKNDINVVIGVRRGEKELLGVTVNRSWRETGNSVNGYIADNAALIADAEKAIRKAMKNANFQLDLQHAITEVSYKLWQQGASKEDREHILTELKRIVYTLKNSVEKHVEDGDMERLKGRIDRTLEELRQLAKLAKRRGYNRVTKFIRNSANHLVTFARLVIAGITIPWTSNTIERLMGEIAKRIKNKWMHWSERGLQNLLDMLLVRYCNRERYKEIWKRYVNGPLTNIWLKAKITIGGVSSTYFGT